MSADARDGLLYGHTIERERKMKGTILSMPNGNCTRDDNNTVMFVYTQSVVVMLIVEYFWLNSVVHATNDEHTEYGELEKLHTNVMNLCSNSID